MTQQPRTTGVFKHVESGQYYFAVGTFQDFEPEHRVVVSYYALYGNGTSYVRLREKFLERVAPVDLCLLLVPSFSELPKIRQVMLEHVEEALTEYTLSKEIERG